MKMNRKLTDEDENSIREIFYKVLDDTFKMLFPNTDIIKSDYICELMEAENNLINQINSSIAHELFFSEQMFANWFMMNIIDNLFSDSYNCYTSEFYESMQYLYSYICDFFKDYFSYNQIIKIYNINN